MSMPPRTLGERGHVVLVEHQCERCGWTASVDGRTLPVTFPTEPEARAAVASEAVRLDGIAYALLRRVRRDLRRKQ
ncbi:MAG TPA: hypothetical protein VLC54_00200 [Anaeromyxobacter sp.]|nr:hypothetical protein [Anaeromyxobacter sp.]